MSSTRREVLYQIAASVTAGAAAPLAAQQAPAHAAHKAPVKAPSGPHRRRVFTDHEFRTLQGLSDWIIPPDERSKGGIEAGTAEFIDVIAASDPGLQYRFTGGIAWLDNQMQTLHGKAFRDCTRDQQKAMLDRLAWRERAPQETAAGVEFFALMRSWTVDAFYSSKAGIEDLGYVGNTALTEFKGCSEEAVKQLLAKSSGV
jgi:gluconate 2-dehydrogenase gamma chain